MERGRGRDAAWRAAERHEHDRGCFRGCVTGSDGCWRVERGEAHFGGSDAAVPPVHDDHHSGLRVLRSSGLLLYGTVRGGGGPGHILRRPVPRHTGCCDSGLDGCYRGVQVLRSSGLLLYGAVRGGGGPGHVLRRPPPRHTSCSDSGLD